MTDDYTPDTHTVRERYWIATVNKTIFPGVDEYANSVRAEFDRWLRKVRAEAWDVGFEAGMSDCGHVPEVCTNPYREEH